MLKYYHNCIFHLVQKLIKGKGKLMNLTEFYQTIGVDVSLPLQRFANNENLLKKFLKRSLTDPTYRNLLQFMEEKNYPEAFRAAHTLKGVCLNMEFTPLVSISNELTELLRDTDSPDLEKTTPLLEQITELYEKIITSLQQLD